MKPCRHIAEGVLASLFVYLLGKEMYEWGRLQGRLEQSVETLKIVRERIARNA